MSEDFWTEEDKEEKHYKTIIETLLIVNMILFLITSILIIRVNKRIDDFEDTQLQLHEYILNRIEYE